MEGGSTHRLTRNDALTYLNAVKETFHDNTQTYDDFLNVMKDSKAHRIDVIVVRGYEILSPLDQDPTQTKPPFRLDEVIKYVKKVKTRFEGSDHVYKSFINILAKFGKGNASTLQVFEEVSLLFKGHPDLVEEFFSYTMK